MPDAVRPSYWKRLKRRLQAPFRLRALIRSNEIVYTLVAAIVGALAGLGVVAMQALIALLGRLVFDYEGHGVSGAPALDRWRIFFGPVAGGVLLGITYLIARRYFRRISDPIEANAIQGGRMELPGSLFICVQTVISSGFGASVGMEAAYTQNGSAIASKLGQFLHLRREDLRQLVAAGAGGAIAAAFDAPLTGAFYAFELVLASYTVASLLPVIAASISAVAVARTFGSAGGFDLNFAGNLSGEAYALIGLLAVICSGFGILIMHSVGRIERLFRTSPFPDYLHPVIGGIAVGLIALVSPSVLSSGHGVLGGIVDSYLTIGPLVAILLLKTLASIVSLGSGFRGGLFFASIFLGAVLGKVFGIAWLTLFGLDVPIIVFSVVGMCALATAIIGAPLAMSFLALELTKSLPLALAVLFSALISAAIARRFFGFSFATWRFHLRGETIRSAADIGWLRELSVGKLMRKTSATVAQGTTVAEARRRFPLGSTKAIVLVDEGDRYAGMVSVSDLHQQERDASASVSTLARGRNEALRPDMNVKEAIAAFSRFERDMLVVTAPETEAVLGTLSEAYSLRRYAEEMNKRLYPHR